MREPTNTDVIAAWSHYPEHLIEGFGEEGDLIRHYLLNPKMVLTRESGVSKVGD